MLMVRVGCLDDDIRAIDISKHARNSHIEDDNDDTYRLICAAVSSISIGTANAIDEIVGDYCHIDIVSDDQDPKALNHVTIRTVKNSSKLQVVLRVAVIQLQTIAESYPQYIDMKITEV